MKSLILVAAVTFLLALFAPKESKGRGSLPVDDDELDAIKKISYLGAKNLPRGLRNNNPGNLEKSSSNHWKGKIPLSQNTDDRFEQFEAYIYGVRAMIKLIRDSYIGRSDLSTIELIIHKYAPMSENDTRAYISSVSKKSGIARDALLTKGIHHIKPIVQAMADHENGGVDIITDDMFNAAWSIS